MDLRSAAFGFGLGTFAAMLVMYLVVVKPLIWKLTHMMYGGFRPTEPIERPKSAPVLDLPRED